MQKTLSLALLGLLVALTGGTLVIVYDVHRDLSEVHSVLGQAGGALRVYEKAGLAIAETTKQLNQTIAQATTAVSTLNDAANAQKKNWLDASGDVKKTGEDTRRVVAHVDRILTHFDLQTLPALDLELVANGDQLQDTIGRLGDSADALGGAAKTLEAQLGNPQIPELLGHIDMTAMHLEAISSNFEAITGDVRPMVHRFAGPPTRKQRILTGAKDFGGLIYLGVKIATLP